MKTGIALSISIILFVALIIFFGYKTQPEPPVEAPATTQPANLPNLIAPTVAIIDPVRGRRDAPLTIVEFGDYFCGFCQEVETTLSMLLAKYPREVRLVWKDFPNESLHPGARQAAEAAHCADEQGAFWEYHDLLLAATKNTRLISYPDLAARLSLDRPEFEQCLADSRAAARVDRNLREALALQLPGVPYFFINGQAFGGTTLAEFAEEIEKVEVRR